eukprot:m.41039 g.41039  ORF g.41039 m.41039 type:complete len:767 (-) comp5648_c0_seq1:68-2368(-)
MRVLRLLRKNQAVCAFVPQVHTMIALVAALLACSCASAQIIRTVNNTIVMQVGTASLVLSDSAPGADLALGIVESSIATSLANEVLRATTTEGSLAQSISIERVRALGAESSVTAALTTETTRAMGVEGSLGTALSSEQLRAILAEQSISVAIPIVAASQAAAAANSEQQRAVGIEGSVAATVSSERSRALSVEASLQTVLVQTQSSLAVSVQTQQSTANAVSAQQAVFASQLAALNSSLLTALQQLSVVSTCAARGQLALANGTCVGSVGGSGSSTTITTSPGACAANGSVVGLAAQCVAGFAPLQSATSACSGTTFTCVAVACPTANTWGINVPAGCTCNAGYSGTVTPTLTAPYYINTCQPVACPQNSTGQHIIAGCTCSAGFTGTVMPSAVAPFVTSNCTPVPCPANSAGASVPSGCSCNAGWSGAIIPTTASPAFFSGSCGAVACPAGSTGAGLPYGCTCSAGYTGGVTAAIGAPYYTGACNAVPCLAGSVGTAPSCYCDGKVGTVTATTTSPFYTLSCSTGTSCAALKASNPIIQSGAYQLQINGINGNSPVQIFCDFSLDGGIGYAIIFNNYFAGYQPGPSPTTMSATTVSGTVSLLSNFAIAPGSIFAAYNGGATRMITYATINQTNSGGVQSGSTARWVRHMMAASTMVQCWNGNSNTAFTSGISWLAWPSMNTGSNEQILGSHGTTGGVYQWALNTNVNQYTTFEYCPVQGTDPNHYWYVGDGSATSSYFRDNSLYGAASTGTGVLFNRWGGIAIY